MMAEVVKCTRSKACSNSVSQQARPGAQTQFPKRLLLLIGVLAGGLGCSTTESIPSTTSGTLTTRDGSQPAGVAVRLVQINDSGEEIAQLSVAVTDTVGGFTINLPQNTDASLVLTAQHRNETLRGFFGGTNGQAHIHPLTEALVSLVLDITSSPDSRHLSDFSANELHALRTQALAINPSSLGDIATLRQLVRESTGRAIAQASGGQIVVRSSAAFDADATMTPFPFAVVNDACTENVPIHIMPGDTFRFDLEEDGTLCGDSHASLPDILSEGAMKLSLQDESFFLYGGEAFPASGEQEAEMDSTGQVVLGPYHLEDSIAVASVPTADALTVTRKVFIAPGQDIIRYTETLHNDGPESRSLEELRVSSFLRSGAQSALLTFDGQSAPSAHSRFIAVSDPSGSRPSASFIIHDGRGNPPDMLYAPTLAGGRVNEVAYAWRNLTLDPYERLTIVHFAALHTSHDPKTVKAQLLALALNPDLSHLSFDELSSLYNVVANRGTIEAEAGSVIGGASVTATNLSQDTSRSTTAANDGSFALLLPTNPGDMIQVTASDGLEQAFVAPDIQ